MAKKPSGMKMSPRKAMAMGKKPSGGKSKVKKFAMGGSVMGAPVQKKYTGIGDMSKAIVPPQAPAMMPSNVVRPRAVPMPVRRAKGGMVKKGCK